MHAPWTVKCLCWTRFWLWGNTWQVERNLEILSLLHSFPVSFPSTDVPDVLPVRHSLVMVSHVMSTSISFQFIHSRFIPSWFQLIKMFVHVLQCPASKNRCDIHRNFGQCFPNVAIHPGHVTVSCQERSGTWTLAVLQMQTRWRSLTPCPSCKPEIRWTIWTRTLRLWTSLDHQLPTKMAFGMLDPITLEDFWCMKWGIWMV